MLFSTSSTVLSSAWLLKPFAKFFREIQDAVHQEPNIVKKSRQVISSAPFYAEFVAQTWRDQRRSQCVAPEHFLPDGVFQFETSLEDCSRKPGLDAPQPQREDASSRS